MLVLSRKEGEALVITDLATGERATVRLVRAQGGKAVLGIEAGPNIRADREEIDRRRHERQTETG